MSNLICEVTEVFHKGLWLYFIRCIKGHLSFEIVKIQMDIAQCNSKDADFHTKLPLTCTHPESNWYKTWQRCFITFTSYGVEFEHWPLWIGFTNRFWNSFFVPNSFGLTKSTITKSMDDFCIKQKIILSYFFIVVIIQEIGKPYCFPWNQLHWQRNKKTKLS